jgi:Fe-S cluster assembly protein SufD
MTKAVEMKELYISNFGKPGITTGGKDATWLKVLREKALASFKEAGFPTPKDEYWRYTDLSTSLLKVPFGFETESGTQTAVMAKLKTMGYSSEKAHVAVFVNGSFAKELSSFKILPKGVVLQSLASTLSDNSIKTHFNCIHSFEGRPLAALNTAFFADGLFLRLPPSQILSEPVHVVYLSTNSGKNTQSHPRNLVVLESDSRATVIEHYLGDAAGPYLTNAVTEVRLFRGAEMEHIKIQQEDETAYHIGTLAVKQGEGSRLVSRTFSFGGLLARNEVETVLAEKKAECSLEGLYLVKDQQHSDNRTFIDHLSPACKSGEFFKGVLDGEGTGIMDGHILVRENAQKTDARQSSQNLQLSNSTKVYSKPQLHIYADDVKCSHGSATGQLAEESLFYLQSRGIGREEAKKLLVYAFADEMVKRLQGDYVKAPLRQMVQAWMEGNKGKTS